MLFKILFFDTLMYFQLMYPYIFSRYNYKNHFNNFIELNKILNNVCII